MTKRQALCVRVMMIMIEPYSGLPVRRRVLREEVAGDQEREAKEEFRLPGRRCHRSVSVRDVGCVRYEKI